MNLFEMLKENQIRKIMFSRFSWEDYTWVALEVSREFGFDKLDDRVYIKLRRTIPVLLNPKDPIYSPIEFPEVSFQFSFLETPELVASKLSQILSI